MIFQRLKRKVNEMFEFKKKKNEFHEQLKRREEMRYLIKEIVRSSPIVNLLAFKFAGASGLSTLRLLEDTTNEYERIVTAYKHIGEKLADNKDADNILKLDSKIKCISARVTEEIAKKTDELTEYMVNTSIDEFSEDVLRTKKEEIESISKRANTLIDELENTSVNIIRTKLRGIIDEIIKSTIDAL